MTVTVAEAVDAAARSRCMALRQRVFVLEQHVPLELEVDGEDDHCVHFLAVSAGVDVGTARLKALSALVAKAQRVAVDAGHRKHGVGRALMLALESAARARGHTSVVLSSQVSAIGFYERLGYVAHGDVYDDAGIPHRDMTKPLT
jgi:predicted GNAT family N-acyltransferase